MDSVSITLRFNIVEVDRLVKLADQAIERHGDGVEVDKDNPLAFRVAELLLHSNPDIKPFLDYGIEFQCQELQDHSRSHNR